MNSRTLSFLLAGFMCVAFLTSLLMGDISLEVLFHDKDLFYIILETTRLPRTLLAILTGGMLGLTGAFLQGFLRNPLADAGLIGISSAASFGSALAMTLGISTFFSPFFGVLGACLLMIFLYLILEQKPSILTLILIGLSFNSLFSALTALTLNLSPNPYKNLEIIFWLLGSFTNQSLESILITLPFLILGMILLWRHRAVLDAMSLGKDMAETLGYSLKRNTQILVISTALCIGPLAALGGTIGFVGLITPHILRYFIKSKPSTLLIPSAFGGAMLCLLADMIIRLLPTQTELKIGVITSLLGAPFFLSLILKKQGTSHDSF